MRVVSWNMNRLGRSERTHLEAWDYLRNDLKADLALVQEASPSEGLGAKVYRPIGEKPYNWGSAIVAMRPDLTLQPRRRVALAESLPAAVAFDELPDSHPGASAVADVHVDGRRLFTAVSLYAQWEMMPGGKTMYAGPRLHRMLSDLTGVLAFSHRNPVVLAGDFNVTSQGSRSSDNEAAAVFARLRAWRMADCVALKLAGQVGVRIANARTEPGVLTLERFGLVRSWTTRLSRTQSFRRCSTVGPSRPSKRGDAAIIVPSLSTLTSEPSGKA